MTKTTVCILTLVLLLGLSTTTWAGDNIQVTVNAVGTPAPSLKLNGNDTTQGTIQLFYTVNAFTFPVGNFAVFSLDMLDAHLNGTNNASYPATLSLVQNGSENIVLTPGQSTFQVNGLGWSGSTNVQISIAAGVPNLDGTDLVGNLNMNIPGPNKVGTPTTIQVHIRLVHPTACLKAYDFITDADFNGVVTSTNVNVHNGTVKSSQPGQFSDNVLIVNTCPTAESIDLSIHLDPRWETNPNSNPGNAVFTYSTAGEISPSTFEISGFQKIANEGQSLCLQDVSIDADTTFLASVHSQVTKGLSAANLGTSPFVLSASALQAKTACTGNLDTLVIPNPASVSLPFTISN